MPPPVVLPLPNWAPLSARMPSPPTIVPLLLMPLVNVLISIKMPKLPGLNEIVPLLVMPPETVALLVTKIPPPLELMMPAFETAPPILLLLIVMPVALAPVPEMWPMLVLVTLPVTVEFWILMQLMELELVTAATVTPLSLIAQAANAVGAPLPIISAATELDANSKRNRNGAIPSLFLFCRPRAEPDLGTVMRNPGAESWVATTLAPCASRPSPHLPHHAGAAVDARRRGELAVEFGEEGPAVGELVHGAAGGEHAVARRHGAVDDEVREPGSAWKIALAVGPLPKSCAQATRP